MEMPELQQFSLVGGTALALKYGHRISVDLDLFGTDDFDKKKLSDFLQHKFGEAYVYEGDFPRFGIFCYIHDVKVDIVHYPHPVISGIETTDDIRMYNDRDIIAMKLNAILGRARKKDFWDLFELLKHYSLDQMITFHQEKYPGQMLLISIPQALVYFTEADEDEDPVSLNGKSWDSIKQNIRKHVSNYLK